MFDYLIVGAGFAGSVLAERLASAGKTVFICDKRDHIAGNAYDYYNEDGILVHKYGPHIFHTSSFKVFQYLSKFTLWRPYEHEVLAHVDGKLVPFPININTLNTLYGLQLNPKEAEEFLKSRAENVKTRRTSEDVVVSQIGRDLYKKFFRNYTRKQWGMDPSELDASVAARVPARTTYDNRYFLDEFQAMPLHGYTRMFENMLDHNNIRIELNADYQDLTREVKCRAMIYTGPIDAFFNYRFGELGYRSLTFDQKTLNQPVFQPAAVVNYPNEHPYTRITEFKYLTGQSHHKTSIVYEYPCAHGDPYYPIPTPQNAQCYRRYKALTESMPKVKFVGRLGTYRYYNMDQVVAQALTTFEHIVSSKSNTGVELAA